MISSDEVRIYIPYAPTDSCQTISRYIQSLYNRRHNGMDSLEYTIEVTNILKRVATNYNPKLGHLVRYTKNTLSLKLKDYVARNYIPTTPLLEDVTAEVLATSIKEEDLTSYSDTVIQAIYNVVKGEGSKKDKDMVNELFNIELKEK